MKWEFRCRVCRELRPDEFISVISVDRSPKGAPEGTVTEHINYCNDRPQCHYSAIELSKKPDVS